MSLSYKKSRAINNIDKCYMNGTYIVAQNAANVPNSVESTVHTINHGANTASQLIFQYHNSVYAGRCYFRVGNVPQLSNGQPSSNWQVFHELHSVGYPYSANFIFALTATYNIGSPNATANNIYAQNAVTVVSDVRYKTEISELTEQELQCAIACSKLYRKYKLNAAVDEKGLNAARYHIGVIAQEVVQCFTDHGLDWRKYGIITYDKWDAIEAVEYQAATYDENDQELTPEIQAIEGCEAGEIYMVRYDELNCFINAGIEYRLSRLE